MKIVCTVVAVLLCGALALPAAAASPQDHHHHDAAPATADASASMPALAQRYQPDAPLSAGMRTVHQAVEELRHAEMGHMSPAMIKDRATIIGTAVADMFANCKLKPKPDAALHGILVPLLAAAQKLKVDPADTAPVASMREVISAYPRWFDDTGWDQPATDGTD